MRYDKRYTRVLDIITAPEIPRLSDGGVALCHPCQRTIMFANGFLDYLVNCLEWEIQKSIRESHHQQRANK